MDNAHSLDSTMKFGKYRGISVRNVIEQDAEYIAWALKNARNFELDKEAQEYF